MGIRFVLAVAVAGVFGLANNNAIGQPISKQSAPVIRTGKIVNLYVYSAYVTSVYDGDTITVDIDLGFGVWKHKTRLRLARINAPEMRGSEKDMAKEARDWLRTQILNKRIIIQTIKDKQGKYGRYLAEIWFNRINLNDELVANSLAKYQKY